MKTLAIAKGELWLHDGAGSPRQIVSAFAREVIERDERSRRTTSWKHAPREQQSGVIPSSSLWGTQQSAAMAPPKFLQACFGANEHTIYYVLKVGEATGLFRQHLDEDREVRLFHRTGFSIDGLAYNPHDQRLVLGVRMNDGTAQLEVYDEDGNLKGAITGGDSQDGLPSLVPGSASTIVFQSTGVARHPEHGYVVAASHATVCKLDYRSGQLETLLDDKHFDFIAPKMGADGTLYAIRRPIEKPPTERASNALLDTVMMPIRLIKAVFGFLNIFSMLYGKEPLRSAGGPRTPELDQDLGRLWLHGRMIELSKVRNDPGYAGHLVPASWELVRQPPGRQLQIVANHVAGFDVLANGQLLYTNGYELTHWQDGRKTSLGHHELIETVTAR